MLIPPKNPLKDLNGKDLSYIIGAVIGVVATFTISLLVGAYVIHWILTAVGIKSLTYAQVVGLLAIWELVKPSQAS